MSPLPARAGLGRGGLPQARSAALDRAARLPRNCQDVPIVVAWNGGGSHVQMLTDGRGKGDDRQYLLTDPWRGSTPWVNHRDIERIMKQLALVAMPQTQPALAN